MKEDSMTFVKAPETDAEAIGYFDETPTQGISEVLLGNEGVKRVLAKVELPVVNVDMGAILADVKQRLGHEGEGSEALLDSNRLMCRTASTVLYDLFDRVPELLTRNYEILREKFGRQYSEGSVDAIMGFRRKHLHGRNETKDIDFGEAGVYLYFLDLFEGAMQHGVPVTDIPMHDNGVLVYRGKSTTHKPLSERLQERFPRSKDISYKGRDGNVVAVDVRETGEGTEFTLPVNYLSGFEAMTRTGVRNVAPWNENTRSYQIRTFNQFNDVEQDIARIVAAGVLGRTAQQVMDPTDALALFGEVKDADFAAQVGDNLSRNLDFVGMVVGLYELLKGGRETQMSLAEACIRNVGSARSGVIESVRTGSVRPYQAVDKFYGTKQQPGLASSNEQMSALMAQSQTDGDMRAPYARIVDLE